MSLNRAYLLFRSCCKSCTVSYQSTSQGMLHMRMHRANPLSFLHFQSHGSLFSAFSKLSYSRIVAWMRSEVNTGTSFPSLRPCGDRSVLAACSSAAWLHPKLGCYSHEIILGDEDGLYKQKALRSSLKHHCSRRGLGKGGWPPSLP